jgi:hypothetical protein
MASDTAAVQYADFARQIALGNARIKLSRYGIVEKQRAAFTI